jgi:hypothetical protein
MTGGKELQSIEGGLSGAYHLGQGSSKQAGRGRKSACFLEHFQQVRASN